MFAVRLKCVGCGAIYSLAETSIVCTACHNLLDVRYDLEEIQRKFDKTSLKTRVHSIWRYREFLPIAADDSILSLGEGVTPLRNTSRYLESVGLTDLTLKLDHLNPTGSFKDRGTTVAVSKVREMNVKAVMDDSSGNAGASLAAYCAAAGIDCTLYVPANAPREKLVQAEIYGAKIVKVAGSRSDVTKAAQNAWRTSGTYYASHNLSPFFFEGMKTLAYEIAEDLGWRVPDHIVFPVGGGALLAGAWKGFEEMKRLGWIGRVPALHCVQSEACMPIVESFRKEGVTIEPVVEGETIAGGIRISNPARGGQVLQALKSTHGMAVSVTDDAILKHQKLLARREGIFAEPTSCAALAGLEKLGELGALGRDESVVVPLTGFGLKDTKKAAAGLARQN